MSNAGITRIVITDQVNGKGAWRFAESRKRWSAAVAVYRELFEQRGMALLPGDEEIRCSLDEFMAGYDAKLGIDVLLRFTSGMQSTIQEKFLYTAYRTVTVEYMQDWRNAVQGDWFNIRADYYFVGYDRTGANSFQEWVLLDWPATQRATAQNRVDWQENQNMRDNARASFRYAEFDTFPDECVFDRYPRTTKQQAFDTLVTIAGQKPRETAEDRARRHAQAFIQEKLKPGQKWSDLTYDYRDEPEE